MSKQGKDTGKVAPLWPSQAAKIEPLDGWNVQTKYGTLRLTDGTDCVRLQDVHSWFLSAGLPAPKATSKLFSPFYEAALKTISPLCDAADELAACKLIASLRLVCANSEPVQLFGGRSKCGWGVEKSDCENMRPVSVLSRSGEIEARWIEREYVPFITFQPTPHLVAFRANFPDLGHIRFEHDSPAGLIYAMAEGVARVWRGPVVAATDPVFTASVVRDRDDEAHYQVNWPADETLSLALERVAVPIATAYELWGWGRMVYDEPGQTMTAVQPPTEWSTEIELNHGRSKARYFQKADANTPLVRIVEVLASFAAQRGIPAGAAVGDFLAAVNVPLLHEVYWLRENQFAEVVKARHMYGSLTTAEAEQKTREARAYADEMRWEAHGASAQTYTGAASPLEALKAHIKEASTTRANANSLYAVSHATANRLWGWGSVAAEPEQATGQPVPAVEDAKPKKTKEKDKSPDWTGQKLLARQTELKKDIKAYAAQTAREAGISVREAARRIEKHKKDGAIASVAEQLKSTGEKNKAA